MKTKDKREDMAAMLLDRGHATMRDILEVSYGEWPLKGLDIDPCAPLDQTVEIALTHDNVSGWAHIDSRKIEVNKEALLSRGAGLLSTIGHEGLHVLQFDYERRGEELFGHDLGRKVNPDGLFTKIMSDCLARDEKRLHDEFNRASAQDKEWVKNYNIDSGREVQARLHVLLSNAYQDWKDMPQSRDELQQALASSGLVPPPEIATYLAALPVAARARHFKHADDYFPSPKEKQAVKELNMVCRTLTEQGDLTFWRETLPALYANLIEMYGDRLGRERFGLGPNTIGKIQRQAASKAKTAAPSRNM